MENNKLPYISVIITACIRKEFLMNAIKSVLNQTLDKKYYEIIVIKNFQDDMIDNYILENHINGIISNDKSLSGKLSEALKIAKGNVISFLDDDDLFFENKLDIVYNEFKKDNNITYYHNLCVPINRNGKTINVNSINTSLDFNMSSISIKKCIVKINKTDKINVVPDVLMYLYALESNKKIIKGTEKLTYYMFHNSASISLSKNFEEYRTFTMTLADLNLNSFIFFKNLIHSKKAINYLNFRITDSQIQKYILGSNDIPTKLINYIINGSGSLKHRFKIFLTCMLIKVYPNTRRSISNKMWNNHSKWINEMI